MPETSTVEQQSQLVTLRALNEYVYCPRLHYFMFVQQVFTPSADTVEGSAQHKRVATRKGNGKRHSGTKPEAVLEEFPWQGATEVELSDDDLGITGRLDAVRFENNEWHPVEAKHGSSPATNRSITWNDRPLQAGAWASDQVQLCAQGLLLSANGLSSPQGVLYYRKSRTCVEISFSLTLINATLQVISGVRQASEEPMPLPLIDSPKCLRCSLNHICIPDESNLLRQTTEQQPRRIVPGRPDGGVLYLSSQGATLRVRQDSLVVEKPSTGEKQNLPLKDVVDVAIFGNIQVTTQCLNHLMRSGRNVSYHTLRGTLNGVAHGLTTQNVFLRRQQFLLLMDETFSLPLGRELVKAKIMNQRTLVRRNANAEENHATLAELKALANATETAGSRNVLMGLEGRAARIYFAALNKAIKEQLRPVFSLEGRNRRPPQDPVNALLSFGYSLLLRDAWSAAARVGLDPMYGFFHVLRPGRPALALDLMEPFRPIIVDSLLLRVINSREMQESLFVHALGGVYLTEEGRKKFIGAYERRLNDTITHPLFGYRISYRRVLEVEARILARVLEGDLPAISPLTTR